jgi:hypothetical protein
MEETPIAYFTWHGTIVFQRTRERDGHDEERGHLDFRVAEVVLEEAGDREGGHGQQSAG